MVQPEHAQDYTHADPVTDAALEWFLRLRHDADTVTVAEFEAWQRQDTRHAAEFRAVQALWDGEGLRGAVSTLPANLPGELGAPSRPGRWRRAAAVVLFAILGGAALHAGDFVLELRADYHTHTGEMRDVTLPDGSLMTLNSDSAVALDFDGDRRAVRLLRGEAYFDVKHDPVHPFRVTGGFGSAEVKGTAFSFRLDRRGDEIVLQRGRLEVRCNCEDPHVVTLLPEQETTISDQGARPATPTESEQRLAWREGRAVFSETNVAALVEELARYWSGHIILARSDLSLMRVSGSFQLNDIPGALASVAVAVGAQATRLPGGIIILR